MAKYTENVKNHGRKILAVVLALVTIIATSSVDLQALAAEYGGLGNTTGNITSGGAIGQVITNSGSGQQVTNVKFKMDKQEGVRYAYTAKIYQNLTNENNPESGVLRYTTNASIAAGSEELGKEVSIDIGNGTDGNPIVLTDGETLGVAITISTTPASAGVTYYQTAETATGFRKVDSSSGWAKRGNIIKVTTEDADDNPDDVTGVTINPDKKYLTLGEDTADINLNTEISPKYKREITVNKEDDKNALAFSDDTHTAVRATSNSGHATVTASYQPTSGTAKTASADIYVIEITGINDTYQYTGADIKPVPTVKCGTTLVKDTDYTLTYSPQTDLASLGTKTVTVTGKAGTAYSEYSKTYSYEVVGASIEEGDLNTKIVNPDNYTIDNGVVTGNVDGLTQGVDYTATAAYKSSTYNTVTYTITVEGQGNYSGTVEFDKTVTAGSSTLIDISDVVTVTLTPSSYSYTGEPIKPVITKTDGSVGIDTDKYPTATLTFNDKYSGADVTSDMKSKVTLSYEGDTINAQGDKYVVLTGKEGAGYTGAVKVKYNIKPESLNDTAKVSVVVAKQDGKDYWLHTGSEVKPGVTVTYNGNTLTQGTDYDVEYNNNVNVGKYAEIKLTGKGNYKETRSVNFEIIPDFEKDAQITIGGNVANYANGYKSGYSIAYTGREIIPVVSDFKLAGEDVSEDDYTISITDNRNVGDNTAKVTVSGTPSSKYKDKSFTATFSIVPKALTGLGISATIDQQTKPVFDGTAKTLTNTALHKDYVLKDGDSELAEDTDYTVSYDNNVNAGNGAKITFTGKGNYTGSLNKTFTIDPHAISDNDLIEVTAIQSQSYTGKAIEPEVEVRNKVTDTLLTKGVDYQVTYQDNVNISTDTVKAKAVITAKANSNYTGARTEEFVITPKTLGNLTYRVEGTDYTSKTGEIATTYVATYTGSEVWPSLEIKDQNGNKLTKGVDYDVDYYNNINAGNDNAAAMIVSGLGNYAGTDGMYITFTIRKISLADATITVDEVENVKHPIVKDGIIKPHITVKYGNKTLTEDIDYKIESTETAAGTGKTAKIVPTENGNYEGEQTITDLVYGYNLAEIGLVNLYYPGETTNPQTTFEYVGTNRPTVDVSANAAGGGGTINANNYDKSFEVIEKGTDNDGYGAGSKVRATVTGKGTYYYGSASSEYNIVQKDISELTVTDGNPITDTEYKSSDWNYIYDSDPKAVLPVFAYNYATGGKLTQGTDFTVSQSQIEADVKYDTDGNVTTTPVTVTAKGNYTGTRTLNYKVSPRNVNTSTKVLITVTSPQTYTGSPITPSPDVKQLMNDGSTKLIGTSSGYTVRYEDNTAVSTDTKKAKVYVTGNKNYTGEAEREFTITKRELTQDNTTISVIDESIYDGQPKTPSFIVTYTDVTGKEYRLTKDVDYTVEYQKNIKFGVGTDSASSNGPVIEITGKDNYEGIVYKGFTIKGDLSDTSLFTITGPADPKYEIKNGTITITDTDYSVRYEDPDTHAQTEVNRQYYSIKKPTSIEPGPSKVTITGDNKVLVGSRDYAIKLIGNLKDAEITGINENYDYTGSAVKPKPTVKYNGETIDKDDYTVTYDPENPTIGNVTLKVKPADDNEYFTGSKETEYTITKDLSDARITGYQRSYEYTGSAIEPGENTYKPGTNPPEAEELVVKLNGVVVPTNEYTVVYGDNTEAADDGGTITIKAKGTNTSGSKTVKFDITPIHLTGEGETTNWTASFSPSAFDYTGNSIIPTDDSLTVTYKATNKTVTLKSGTDYTWTPPADTVKPGAKTVNITPKGNYYGNITASYLIGEGKLSDAEITVKDAYYACGEEVTPYHSVVYEGVVLTEGTDYTVEYETGRDRTKPTYGNPIKITFKAKEGSNFTGAVEKEFNINPADFSKGAVKIAKDSVEFTGSEIAPEIEATIYSGTKEVVIDPSNYTVTFDDGSDTKTDVGTYNITVTGDGIYFINSLKTKFKITPRQLDATGMNVSTIPDQQWDSGNPVTPGVTIIDTKRNNYELVEGTDYTIAYANNSSAGVATATISGMGNYGGEVERTFNIGTSLSDTTVALENYSYPYDSKVHTPKATVKKGNTTLVEGRDFEVIYQNADGTDVDANAGQKIAVVRGINAYFGEKIPPITYEITPKVARNITIVPDLQKDDYGRYYATYTGAPIEPTVKVYDNDVSTTVPMDESNYSLSYAHNQDMTLDGNPAEIKVSFKNNYDIGSDVKIQNFIIKAKDIEGNFQAYMPGGTQYSYTGYAVEPEVVVRPTTVDVVDTNLIPGEDYTLTYQSNVNAGTATATVTGIGNYSGTVVLPFNVVADLGTANIKVDPQFYTGQEVHAPLTITCGGNTLTEGVDYAVNYTSPDNWEYTGVATVTSLQPYYSGSATVTYDIVFDPSLLKVTVNPTEYMYDGQSHIPDFAVTSADGTVIPFDKNAVTYMNSNTGPGDTTSVGQITATIPVTIGNKTTTVKAVYNIVSKSINNCTIEPLADNVYTGKALTPPVIIKDKAKNQLRENVDYTLSYSNNVNPGKGVVTVTGKGEYEGKMNATFNIIAPRVLGLTGTVGSDSSVTLSWLKNAHVSGYDIYSQDGSVKYGSTTANSFNIPKSKVGNESVFKVRSYVTVNGKRTDGEFSEVTVYTGLAKPVVTVTSYARKRATLNWNPQTNVSGYEIYRATSADGEFRKIAVMPTTSGGYSDSGLTSGQTYYYKVRAYQKTGENAFVYGHFSDVKSVVVK